MPPSIGTGMGVPRRRRDAANAAFGTAYNNSGIYSLADHPYDGFWYEGSYLAQHIDYISNRGDVWYAAFGELYFYHFVQERGLVSISPFGEPSAADDSYATDEDTLLSVTAPGVLANDSDADGDPLRPSWLTGPSHGALSLNAGWLFHYTPAPITTAQTASPTRANDGRSIATSPPFPSPSARSTMPLWRRTMPISASEDSFRLVHLCSLPTQKVIRSPTPCSPSPPTAPQRHASQAHLRPQPKLRRRRQLHLQSQ